MSASARGTASNYSKGARIRPADFATPAWLLAALALAGALLLVLAEVSPVYEVVVGSLQTTHRSVTGGSNHDFALGAVALLAAVMTAGAVRGARGAAFALVTLGAVALLVTHAVDRPDTRASRSLPEAVDYDDAHARPAGGYALEIFGAVMLVVSGAGFLALERTRVARAGEAPVL